LKLLVLGGTRFLGRHIVDAALARGDEVTVFTRGRITSPWGDRVTHLAGDRDPAKAPGLAALGRGEWDAVIDTSGYVPRCVRASAQGLAGRVGHYTFVSSLSAYAEPTPPGLTESAPLAVLDDPATEDIIAHYGALKAACEREVTAAFGSAHSALVRPGLIVGPYDGTDRFGYWVARFLLPELLGDRHDAAVVPAPRQRVVQFIDARDLAVFLGALAERRVAGVFNACSERGLWTMGILVDTLCDRAEARGRRPRPVWIDDATLVAAGVEPWIGLPLWIPDSDVSAAGFHQFDCRPAHREGLRERPLAATIDDSAAWLGARDNNGAWQHVLTAGSERALLQTWRPPNAPAAH
jgi:2'-hydroxyisoflavone reductase